MNKYDFAQVDKALESAVISNLDKAKGSDDDKSSFLTKVFPGATLLIGKGREILFYKAVGHKQLLPETSLLDEETVFDVASLTKALVTTTLIMKLVDKKLISIDKRVSHIISQFNLLKKETITIQQLLNHSSGLPAYRRFFEEYQSYRSSLGLISGQSGKQFIISEICNSELENPPGRVANYSDLGFIILGELIEQLYGGRSLDLISQQEIFSQLSLKHSGYIDLTKLRSRRILVNHDKIASTTKCPFRNRILTGEVQDENCYIMGGVAGHAGLFSNASDIFELSCELLDCFHGRSDFISKDTIRRFWTRDSNSTLINLPNQPISTWALGFDTPSDSNSSAGDLISKNAVGHLGYTGTSIWIEPEKEITIILLTNRVHPNTNNNKIKKFRPHIHNLIFEALR